MAGRFAACAGRFDPVPGRVPAVAGQFRAYAGRGAAVAGEFRAVAGRFHFVAGRVRGDGRGSRRPRPDVQTRVLRLEMRVSTLPTAGSEIEPRHADFGIQWAGSRRKSVVGA
jgi:hypothetical protein